MTATTLFADWTSVSKPCPATALLEQLIKHLAHDVCSFRRNTQTSYHFIETIRTLIDEINELIERVKDADDWEIFEDYTNAIDPLEGFLLDIGLDEPVDEDVDLLDWSTVDSFTIFIDQWEKNRATIRERLKTLREDKFFSKLLANKRTPQEDIDAAFKHDDRTLSKDLAAGIKTDLNQAKNSGTFPKKMAPLVDEVIRGVGAVDGRFRLATSLPENWDVLAIKSMMAVYGLVKVGANEDILVETRLHLKLHQPWMIAKNLIGALIGYSENNGTAEGVKKLYDDLLEQFKLRSGRDLPASYAEIIKMVAKIGRSYHARSLLMATLCRELAASYRQKEETNERHYLAIQDAFDQTLTTLEKARGTMESEMGLAGLSKLSNFDIDRYEKEACVSDFVSSAVELSSCFKTLGLQESKSSVERLKSAAEKDKARMEKVNSRVQKITNQIDFDETNTIEVTVSIREGQASGTAIGEHTLKAPPTSRLSAIGWKISRITEFKDKIRTTEFSYEHNSTSVSASSDIKTLANDNKLTLVMIV